MSSSSDWWARKLGREPRRPEPGGWGHTQGPSGPPPAQQPPPWPAAGGDGGGPPPTWVIDQNGDKKLNTMAWQGGRATKTETMRCPNCGSSNFFSRTQGHQGERMGIVNQHGQHCPPAPQCAECAYNGVFTIFGGS